MTSSEPSLKVGNRWKMVFAILGIFRVFCLVSLNWNGFMTLIGRGEPDSTLYLYELNESVVPQGNIISLAEEDFTVFPKLAPVIRDKNQKPVTILENGNRLYTIAITDDGRSELIHQFGYNERFFEYNGRYYSYSPMPLH